MIIIFESIKGFIDIINEEDDTQFRLFIYIFLMSVLVSIALLNNPSTNQTYFLSFNKKISSISEEMGSVLALRKEFAILEFFFNKSTIFVYLIFSSISAVLFTIDSWINPKKIKEKLKKIDDKISNDNNSKNIGPIKRSQLVTNYKKDFEIIISQRNKNMKSFLNSNIFILLVAIFWFYLFIAGDFGLGILFVLFILFLIISLSIIFKLIVNPLLKSISSTYKKIEKLENPNQINDSNSNEINDSNDNETLGKKIYKWLKNILGFQEILGYKKTLIIILVVVISLFIIILTYMTNVIYLFMNILSCMIDPFLKVIIYFIKEGLIVPIILSIIIGRFIYILSKKTTR